MIRIQGPNVTVQLPWQYENMMCQVGDYLLDMGKFCTCVDENPSTTECIDNVPNSKSNYGNSDETITFVYKSRFIKQQDILPWMELYGKNFATDKQAFEAIFTVNDNEVIPNALYFATRAEKQNAMLKQHIDQIAMQQETELNNLKQEIAILQQYVLNAQDLQIKQLTEKLTKLESKAKTVNNSYGLIDMWDGVDGDM